MKEFRTTPDGKFLYPWPIIKEQKYLITSPGERAASYLKLLYERGLLSAPPPFEKTVHSDGATPIYCTPEDGPIVPFLKLEGVQGIEKVLSKAMWRFVATDTPEAALAQALQRRFESQLSCSTCQELGIEQPHIKALVDAVLGL